MLSVEDTKLSHWRAVSRQTEAADTPQSALRWTSRHWDGAASRWLEDLRAFASGRRGPMSGPEAFAVVHLCGEKAETRAFPILCRLIAEDRGIADWLDDAVTETLPGILIRVFDGDAALLRNAIESDRGCEFARASALGALGYLVRAKAAMTDEDMRAFLRRILGEVEACWFTVSEDNQAARALHAVLGAREVEVRRGFYGAGDDRILSRIDAESFARMRPRLERLGLVERAARAAPASGSQRIAEVA